MAWAPDYATTAEARAFITNHASTVDDTYLALAVSAASRAVDRHCNRQFGVVAAAEERKYTARVDYGRGRWVVDIDDLMTTTNLEIAIDVDEVDDYTPEPVNAAATGRPWTRLLVNPDSTTLPTGDTHELAITAIWGWTSVPSAVKQATLLQASRLFSRRQSPYGIAGSPDQGSELRLLARVDPDVAVVLSPYVRRRAVA